MIPRPFKQIVRAGLRQYGQEIIPAAQHPASNLMGLRNLGIRTILDIGANTGQFASEATKWFPGVRLYSFEPIPRAFESLRSAQFPSVREFRPLHYALGETDGEVEMNETVNDTTTSSLLKITQEYTDKTPKLQKQAPVRVRLRRLDSVVREEQLILEPEVLIKMDVQGFEDRVIRGGGDTFAQACACIVEIIFDSYYEEQATFLGITQQLQDLGLEYAGNFGQYHDEDGHVAVIDAFFQRKRKRITAPAT